MPKPTGRREAHKRATKQALRSAASRLFAERGVEATTVREIATAAAVTERTFYRYFDGKEELIAEQTLGWIDALHDAICERPADERGLLAIERALLAVAQQAVEPSADGIWLFETSRPGVLRRATARPLLRVERAIASALLARGAEDAGADSPSRAERFDADLLARVAVAVLRNALRTHRCLRDAGEGSPGVETLLRDGFAALPRLVG